MDLSEERKTIKRIYFAPVGLAIITILGLLGILFIYISGLFTVANWDEFRHAFSKYGLAMVFGAFFLGTAILCWVAYYANIIKKPYSEVLHSLEDDDGKIYFIDRKGKKYNYVFDTPKLEKDEYYFVMKTRDYIYRVCKKTTADWTPVEKKSYWLNWYYPNGEMEDLLLLPILYMFLVPGILSLIILKGSDKIIGIFISAAPLFFILYDAVHKYKINHGIDEKYFDNPNLSKKNSIVYTLGAIIAVAVTIWFFIGIDNFFSLLYLCPVYTVIGLGVSALTNNNLFLKITNSLFTFLFIIIWYVVLILMTISLCKQGDTSLWIFLFLIPFYVVPFVGAYNKFIKK